MLIEILVYSIIAISSMFIMGFAVHMFVGGLVSPEAEYQLITMACIIVFCVIGYMAWDVVQRRTGRK